MNGDKREAQGSYLRVGQYQVTFEEAGARIEHQSIHTHYRVQAATATNAVDFLKHHKRLIFAMMGNFPENLEAYRVQQQAERRSE
jgi:hypothetical protein